MLYAQPKFAASAVATVAQRVRGLDSSTRGAGTCKVARRTAMAAADASGASASATSLWP